MPSVDIPSRVLGLLPGLYAYATPEQFAQNVLGTASSAVSGDWYGYNVITAAEVQTLISPSPDFLLQILPQFERFVGEHPFLTAWKKDDNLCPVLSDLTSVVDLHRTGLYNEFYRLTEQEDQLSMARMVGQELLTVTVGRSRRGFSDEDRLAFNLLRPHVIQAHQNLIQARAEIARAAGAEKGVGFWQAIIHLSLLGQPTFVEPGAAKLLRKYFPGGRQRPIKQLPPPLQQWVDRALDQSSQAGLDVARYQPLLLQRPDATLTICLLRTDPQHVVLTLTERPQIDPAKRRINQLPPRIKRVLDLVLAGHSEKEIATQLSLSRHTVHEYIKIMYRKLGFTSRAELIATLLRPNQS